MGGFRGNDLHNIAVFQLGIKLGNMAVDLGGHHVIAHGGMDAVGKVDGRSPGGKIDHIPLGSKDEHLIGKHIHLERVDEVLGIGSLLILQQPAHPFIVVLVPGPLSVLLILPVGGDAVFGDFVHLLGSDLHLKGDAVLSHHGGVERLVHIGLGGADIILEAAQDGLIQIMDDAQDVIALRHGAHDDPEGKQVKHIVQGLILSIHLAVDAVGVLHATGDRALNARLLKALGDLVMDGGHEAVVLRGFLIQGLNDLLVTHRVQIFQAQILQLPLHLLHAQTVGDGGIDLHGLQGLLPLLFRSLVLHGAHIVQPVGHLDEDDTDVLAHGQEHFAQILHLLLRLGGGLHSRQLADPLHNVSNGGGKGLGNVLMGGIGILDGIVEQGGGNGLRVQMQLLRHDLSHRQRMGDEGRAVLAILTPVVLLGKFKGRTDQLKIGAGVILADSVLQTLVLLLHVHGFPLTFL